MSASLRERRYLSVVCVALAWMPSVAFAAGGSEPAEIPWVTIAGSAVNLLLLVALVYFLGWKKIQQGLKNRKESLEQEMSEARALREAAKSELEEIRERTASLDEERERILEEYRVLGETEKERIIKEAEAQAERIRTEAKRTIEYEIEHHRKALEREMLEHALKLADEALRKQVDKKKHNAMVNETIAELGSIEAA